ncbi:MAG: B12-binding domain-containing radical SAM protein [Planctomycetota bacterium]
MDDGPSPREYRHVLCVYPYRFELGRRNGFYPPLGLEIIASVLRPHSRGIDVVDLRREAGNTVDFLRPDTDLVCFSVNWDCEASLVCEQIRSVPPDVLTVVGGRHVTQDPEKWLSQCPNIDILVRGDGEEIAEEIAQGRPLDQVAGISYRLDGRLEHNPVRQCGPARGDLYPDRDLRRYTYAIDQGGLKGRSFDTLASSRGCPYNCTFCSFSRNPWGGKRAWTARSPESVVREIKEIDADVILFLDDNFTHDPDRVSAICDLLLASGIRKRYVANARVEIAKRPDVLRKMERAGFSMLLLGIESAQDKTLLSMRKGFGTKKLREYFRVLRGSRMLLLGYFIIGNIGETEEEMLRIAPFARELGLDVIQLTMLRNERYSGIEELVASCPGYHIASDGLVYSDDYSCARLQQIRRQIHRRFHSLGQVLQIIIKAIRNRLPTPRMFARLPGFIVREILAHRRRKKARRKRRREAREGRVQPT